MTARRYKVLTLDGGGIRGVVPARVLEELERRLGRPVADVFDMVAGTSTGGIIALGLAKPDANGGPAYSAEEMLGLYMKHGPKIFPHSFLLEVKTLHGVIRARYPAEPLEELLHERFGETMLSEALTEVVIPTYDLSAPGPFFFKREYARSSEHDWNVPMAKVARATSAAPTYFGPAVLPPFDDGTREHALVDGGTFANNPAISAYADALRKAGDDTHVLVVSVGTGQPSQKLGTGPIPVLAEHAHGWGLEQWARPILEVVLDGAAKAVEYQLEQIAGAAGDRLECYRLQSSLPTASHAMDDASDGNRKALLNDANTLIAENDNKLDQICAALTADLNA
jgi:predicted acylesterase/phospholipase RssA